MTTNSSINVNARRGSTGERVLIFTLRDSRMTHLSRADQLNSCTVIPDRHRADLLRRSYALNNETASVRFRGPRSLPESLPGRPARNTSGLFLRGRTPGSFN